MKWPQLNKKTGQREDIEISEAEYDEAFSPFYDAQPENLKERYIYRDIVDEFSFQQLKAIPPYLVADYARYAVLQEEYSDKVYERVCPCCEMTIQLVNIRKRAYDEITAALLRLINHPADEVEMDIQATGKINSGMSAVDVFEEEMRNADAL